VPPHECVGSDDGEDRSPVDHPREHHESDSGRIVQAARPEVPLDEKGKLFAKEEILGCEARVG
jgi:hypothetical protein